MSSLGRHFVTMAWNNAWANHRLLGAVVRLSPEEFAAKRTSFFSFAESDAEPLAHLFQHQIHHRGQAHAMLAGTPVAPPQLDEFFCAGEAHLRAAELAELGTSEEEIWAAPD